MTRVYIKNLPRNCREEELRALFRGFAGTVTDVRVCPERRIAFVGFYDTDLATVRRHFDRAYLRGSRISVYMALSHAEALAERRKVPAARPAGAQARINEIYERGGEALQRYLDHTRQREWQNALLTAGDAPVAASAAQAAPAAPEPPAAPQAAPEREIDPCKVKLSGVPASASEQDLLAALGRYGAVREAVLCTDPLAGGPSGIAYVTFRAPGGCHNLLRQKREVLVRGVFVRVAPAAAAPQGDRRRVARALDRTNSLAWRALHQGTHAVARQLAERAGAAPEAVQGDAVLLAAGEALLSRELQERMRAAGLRAEGPRSRNAILAKNVPADVAEADLARLFGEFGTLVACDAFAPGFCLVVFARPQDARRAFGRLAFRKLGAAFAPLMLEFAIMADGAVGQGAAGAGGEGEGAKGEGEGDGAEGEEKDAKEAGEADGAAQGEKKPEETRSIHIKSISFQTDAEKFAATLRAALGADLRAQNLVQGPRGSRGYGFAAVRAGALAASLERLNRVICDGYKWEAEEAAGPRGAAAAGELGTSKLIVKNVPFQASAKELRQLLGQFGRLVTFRAPRKLDNSLRGFAFAEYATEREAAEAMGYLGQTHFYGRHLVVEPSYDAAPEETV